MRKIIVFIMVVFISFFVAAKNEAEKDAKDNIIGSIHWLHHSSFRIEAAGKVIYIDPFEIKNDKPADYIFITHNHYDHMSVVDIQKVAVKSTLIICPKECEKELKNFNLKVVAPGDKFVLEGLKVEAVPAYNNVKPFHTKSSLKVGYVIGIGKARIYHAGDTDFIPEMRDLKDITVAMVPIGGMFTMDPKEAAQAINAIKPEIAVPMHYGYKIGKKENGAEFAKLVDKSIKVDLMKQEE